MLKVLIADDEPIMLEGLRVMVDWPKLGFEICGEAYDGEDALKLMDETRPHLVITDIRMPVIDGLELIEKASEAFPRTKFMILSGYADFQYARRAMRYGVSNYLTKPLDERELEAAIAAVADEIRSGEETLEQERAALTRIREESVSRLMLGEDRAEWLRQAQELLGIQSDTRLRLVQLCGEKEAGAPADSRGTERLLHAAETALLPGVSVLPYTVGKAHRGFILTAGAPATTLPLDSVQSFITRVRATCGWEIPFAVSAEHRGPEALNQAYREVLAAEIGRFPSGKPGVYVFQERVKGTPPIPEDRREALLQAVAAGNADAVRSLTQDLFAPGVQPHPAEDQVRAAWSNIRLDVLKLLVQQGADSEVWTRKWYSQLPLSETGGWEGRMVKDLVEAADWMAEAKGTRVDSLVSAAAEFVRLHYQDKLQLQHVAEHLHVNPAYLGQRFKKHFGVPFNEYLHTVRVEEAKKLLRRAELKISDIASRVGYSDTDQFVAKFKSLTGMLPSAYKKG